MRRLGVYGANLPTRKSKQVDPADFLVGCIVGQFERKYDKAFVVKSPTEKTEIFGYNISSSWFGSDVVDGFFNNVVGVSAKLYVKAHVGYAAGAIDAVVANASLSDGTPEDILTLKAAYQNKAEGALEYGISGNRTGYTVENGIRFTTAIKTASLLGDSFFYVDSVSDIFVGDIIKIVATGAGGATVYKTVTAIEESTGKVSFTGTFDGVANPEVDDVVTIAGFRLRVWRKDINGVQKEADEELGKVWCSTESAVTNYYVENVFSTSKWIDVTRNATTPATLDLTFPINVADVTFLTNGADGTAPTTSANWERDLTKLDGLPFRLIANPETTLDSIQKAIEIYCQGRNDNPKVIYNLAVNRTKAQLITIGNNYQRSDDVLGSCIADSLKITDPFSTSPLAPSRVISNAGHIMGLTIRTIGEKGIHYIPQKDTPIFGIVGLDNENILNIDDDDRTDLADAGINIIQFIKGHGYVLRNMFTPSISSEFKFFNALMMREFIKISCVDSLQLSENQPNNIKRIKADRDACLRFLYGLWLRGSTGSVSEGETFGQSFNEDNTETKFNNHVQVTADFTNNTQAGIDAGERNNDIYFTFPAPAGSIRIGVGLWQKG